MAEAAEPSSRSSRIRRPLFFWVLVGLSALAAAAGLWAWQDRQQRISLQAQPAEGGTVRFAAPDFALTTVEGDVVRLADLRGKVVLLNFWATWCRPCEAEMPDLDALHRRYAEDKEFIVVGINLAESREDVAAFGRRLDLSFPLLLDPNGRVASGAYAVRVLPASMILDREGYVRDRWLGQIPMSAMVARLERIW